MLYLMQLACILFFGMWDTNDWKKKTSNEIVNHVLANAGNGNIVLMHTTANSNSAKSPS